MGLQTHANSSLHMTSLFISNPTKMDCLNQKDNILNHSGNHTTLKYQAGGNLIKTDSYIYLQHFEKKTCPLSAL